MPMEPTMPTLESGNEDMEATFAKLKELDEKEVLTQEDVDWFKSGVVEEAFRSRERSLYVEDKTDRVGDEEEYSDPDNSERSNELELLHRSAKEKVEEWEKNNSE